MQQLKAPVYDHFPWIFWPPAVSLALCGIPALQQAGTLWHTDTGKQLNTSRITTQTVTLQILLIIKQHIYTKLCLLSITWDVFSLCLSFIENNRPILHLEDTLTCTPPHALLPCSQRCTHHDQNTPLTMSRPNWEEMGTVSAHLQHDDAIISGAQGVLMFVCCERMSQTGLWTVVGGKQASENSQQLLLDFLLCYRGWPNLLA